VKKEERGIKCQEEKKSKGRGERREEISSDGADQEGGRGTRRKIK